MHIVDGLSLIFVFSPTVFLCALFCEMRSEIVVSSKDTSIVSNQDRDLCDRMATGSGAETLLSLSPVAGMHGDIGERSAEFREPELNIGISFCGSCV